MEAEVNIKASSSARLRPIETSGPSSDVGTVVSAPQKYLHSQDSSPAPIEPAANVFRSSKTWCDHQRSVVGHMRTARPGNAEGQYQPCIGQLVVSSVVFPLGVGFLLSENPVQSSEPIVVI